MNTEKHPWESGFKKDRKEQIKDVQKEWRKTNQPRITARSNAQYKPRKAEMQERINEALKAEVQREHKAMMDADND